MLQGPTLRRRRLGAALRKARDSRKRSREDVAAELDVSVATVTRWELGRGPIKIRDLRHVMTYLGIVRADERAELEGLAREGAVRGWWTPYTSSIRPTFKTYLDLEAEAIEVGEYSAIVVPGLMQTDEYARAVMRAAVPPLDDETIEARIAVRKQRQERLTAERPMVYTAVVDEGAIRRVVGGSDVWRGQLVHLLDVCAKYRHVDLQILPFAGGAHASILSGFAVLSFLDDPDVAYVELSTADLYTEGVEAGRYLTHFANLRAAALPAALSRNLIERVLHDRADRVAQGER